MRQFELDSLTEYSNEAILEEMRRVAALFGGGPLPREAFKKLPSKVSATTIGRRFGGWKKALRAAGLAHLDVNSFPSAYQEKIDRGRKMSNDDLIAEMQRVHSALASDVLTSKEFDRSSVTHSDVIRERFVHWKTALEAAGIAQSEAGKRYTDERCFENLAAVWTHYGRQPRLDEMKIAPSTVGPKAYILRWGTWRKSLKTFVDWANAEGQAGIPTRTISREVPSQQVVASARKEEDCREVRPGLRFKVFLRDRFRCVACGRSPATHLNVELHADHIKSVYDDGKTIFENLQTLCQDCNLGKGRTSVP
jgi:5-methylcytosine-specific restriction endonuclease McrA